MNADTTTFKPPDDMRFQWLLEGAAQGFLPVYGVVHQTRIVSLRRFDDSFRPDRTAQGRAALATFMRAWNEGHSTQPWLYVDQGAYVVADDYFWIAAVEQGKPSSFAAQVLGEPLEAGLMQKVGPLPAEQVKQMLGLSK
jgi:hypothetical protein